jgi:hypothetical protein
MQSWKKRAELSSVFLDLPVTLLVVRASESGPSLVLQLRVRMREPQAEIADTI